MNTAFYISSFVALAASIMVISRKNAFSALLYMIISLLSVALIFFLLGAAFVAALEIIIYAGAIMVLFVFVVMMLNLGEEEEEQEKAWMKGKVWIGPTLLGLILAVEIIVVLSGSESHYTAGHEILPVKVGLALFGPYVIAVELAGLLITAGIMGAYHLGKRKKIIHHRYLEGGQND